MNFAPIGIVVNHVTNNPVSLTTLSKRSAGLLAKMLSGIVLKITNLLLLVYTHIHASNPIVRASNNEP